MSCAWLSTVLDQEMLEVVRRVRIAPRTVSYQILLVSWQKTGRQVAGELGGRYLLRYLLRHQVGSYINGSTDRHYTTPTPYSPADTVSWLTLPSPTRKRDFVMLLDPTKIDTILGPPLDQARQRNRVYPSRGLQQGRPRLALGITN